MAAQVVNKRKVRKLRKVPCFMAAVLVLCCAFGFNILLNDHAAEAAGQYDKAATVSVVVEDGDNLWGLIKECRPDYQGDMRKLVYEVKKLNGLKGVEIYPGDQIVIPL